MQHVKTLGIYSVGNWEPSRDFRAEEWQNVIFVSQLNSVELEGRREASEEAVAIVQEIENEDWH